MNVHLVVGLLVASLALAGCTGGDDDSTADDFRDELNNGPTETSGVQDDGSTPGQGPGGNDSTGAPGENGTIDVDFTASTLSGNVPLTVTFDLDAVFKDADDVAQGDVAAEWAIFSVNESLGLETEGTDLPAQANFTFEQEGSWVVAAGVKADGYQNRIVNVTIEVLAEGETTAATEIFFLHQDGCPGTPWMDKQAAPGSEEGHGCGGPGTGLSGTWDATVGTANGFPAGTVVEAHVQGFTLTPVPGVTMTGTLLLDGTEVGTGESAAEDSLSVALVTTPCVDWVITFTTDIDIPAGSKLTLEASSSPTGGGAMCYPGGPDGPRVILGAEDA